MGNLKVSRFLGFFCACVCVCSSAAAMLLQSSRSQFLTWHFLSFPHPVFTEVFQLVAAVWVYLFVFCQVVTSGTKMQQFKLRSKENVPFLW